MSLNYYLVCPSCGSAVFERNVTHNLSRMAVAAGVYDEIWGADESPHELVADELVPKLASALADLQARHDYYSQFNPPNGWGSYDVFVEFVQALLNACREHPMAKVRAWA